MTGRAIYVGIAVLLAAVGMTARAEKLEIPPDALILKVGQTLVVTFTASGDSLVNPQIVKEPSPTDPSVTFQLTKAGSARTLIVTNGYARPFVYRAIAKTRGMSRQFEPQLSPVRGGMQGVITLGEPFDELALFEFHLASAP
jgi:hypothetical protein